MVRAGRNQRCPCGSGRKVKHCCGQAKGPSESELAKATLAQSARQGLRRIAGLDTTEIADLYQQVIELPCHDHTMVMPLPRLFTPELARLRQATKDDDIDAIDEALPDVLARCDTSLARTVLLGAAQRLADSGRISDDLAAVIAIDLGRTESDLVRSSIVEAVAVDAGAVRTASGLVVVAAR
jgi:hypothetical protein